MRTYSDTKCHTFATEIVFSASCLKIYNSWVTVCQRLNKCSKINMYYVYCILYVYSTSVHSFVYCNERSYARSSTYWILEVCSRRFWMQLDSPHVPFFFSHLLINPFNPRVVHHCDWYSSAVEVNTQSYWMWWDCTLCLNTWQDSEDVETHFSTGCTVL